MESLCFGARHVFDLMLSGGLRIERVLMTSGLAERNPFLVQMIADVFARPVEVPAIRNTTCVGAAIHGAVAAGIVADFREGAARFGAREFTCYMPRPEAVAVYERLYAIFRLVSADATLREAMHALGALDM